MSPCDERSMGNLSRAVCGSLSVVRVRKDRFTAYGGSQQQGMGILTDWLARMMLAISSAAWMATWKSRSAEPTRICSRANSSYVSVRSFRKAFTQSPIALKRILIGVVST